MVTAQLPASVEERVGFDPDAQLLITVPKPSIGVEEEPLSHEAAARPSEGALTKPTWRVLEPERDTPTGAGADVGEWRAQIGMAVGGIWSAAWPTFRAAEIRPKLLPAPRLVIERQAKALLTSRVREVIQPLVAIAQTQALRSHLHVTSMVVRPFVDPDDDSRELILEIHVSALPAQGLAYWDGLGATLNTYRDTLPAATAAILGDRVSVHVVWPSSDGNGV